VTAVERAAATIGPLDRQRATAPLAVELPWQCAPLSRAAWRREPVVARESS
jgi:hypothetical protein